MIFVSTAGTVMGLFSFLALLGLAYLVWRIADQLPDLIFRLSEIQRDVAEIRRRLAANDDTKPSREDNAQVVSREDHPRANDTVRTPQAEDTPR